MRREIVLVANKGQVIPPVLSEKVVTDLDSSMGVAYIDPEGKLYAGSESAGLTLADFQGHQEDFAESVRVYYFSERDSPATEPDLQPFIALQEGEKILAVVFMAEAFDVPNDGQFSEAYVLNETYLKEKLIDLWEICGKDVGKLHLRMQRDSFKNEMEMLCKPFKSTILFLLSNGETLKFTKGETASEAPWGFTSSTMGLKEGIFPASEAKEEVVVPAKRVIGAMQKTAVAATSVPSSPPKVTKVGETTVIHAAASPAPAPSKTDTAVMAGQKEQVWAVPKKSMAQRKDHDWYYKHNKGVVPTNLADRPPILMDKEIAIKQGSVQIVDAPKGGFKAFSDIKPDEVKTVPEKVVPAIQPQGPVEIIPIHPVEEITKVGTLIQNNKQVVDPADLTKMQTKYATFAKTHKVSPDAMFGWSLNLRSNIARVSPNQAAQAWMDSDYQRMLIQTEMIKLMEEIETLKTAAKTQQAPPAVAAEPPAKRVIGAMRK